MGDIIAYINYIEACLQGIKSSKDEYERLSWAQDLELYAKRLETVIFKRVQDERGELKNGTEN